jgi:hypothetical protein
MLRTQLEASCATRGIPIHRDHATALKTLGESLKIAAPIA